MKNENIREKLIALVNLSNELIGLEQSFIDEWTEILDNKKMTSDQANDIFADVIEGLSNKSHDVYTKYYEIVHSLLSNEKIDEIQKKINYNFMSLDFINELVKEI